MLDATAKISGMSRVLLPGPCSTIDYHESTVETEGTISNGQGGQYSINGGINNSRLYIVIPACRSGSRARGNEGMLRPNSYLLLNTKGTRTGLEGYSLDGYGRLDITHIVVKVWSQAVMRA